jgi:3'(2'), 5'-bisphosphate nucleotidase
MSMNRVEIGSPATLERLCAIARDAGREIRRYSASEVAFHHKADESPVTLADIAAQHCIVEALTAWDSTIPIVAEESEAPSLAIRSGWDRWWLVDPLDGTKEFLSNNGEFTVNIALIARGDPVLGVVLAPALDVIYYAGRGLGAWRQSDSARPERITSRAWRAGQPARIVESRSHPSPALEAYLQSIQVSERIRLGSSLKFCRVAEGAADLYPRFGRTMEWDVAAGDCVFRNSAPAGERRSPIRYNTVDLAVPGFVLGPEDAAMLTGIATSR